MIERPLAIVVALAGCGSGEATVRPARVHEEVAALDVKLPRAPGELAPSLVAIERRAPHDVTDGTMLSDVDSCATCHPDAAAQWSTSAHSFASFGNPIYRFNVEQVRKDLGKTASRHCGGCHDMPLLTDGLMTVGAPIPAADLRAHSGVTCRLCHGVQSTTKDGNGSYVWATTPLDAPVLGDPASIARHQAQVTTKVDTELCVGCHRGFLSPDMDLPVHLTGLDEPGFWRSSAYTGNGMGRIDKVAQQTCIDCHMEREPASADEHGAKAGKLSSHRFVGGHTWMAAMRGDADHLKRTQARLEGAASIDVAGARVIEDTVVRPWHLPADGAPVIPGTRLELDVVIRNLLVGHRFPGGVLDIQDTWIELELADRNGRRVASSGLSHATDPEDQSTHVLRTQVVDHNGEVLEEHELAKFRTQMPTQTLAAREAQAVRYAFEVPEGLQVPLSVTARLRHRSRTLALQAAVCRESRTTEGQAFIAGAKGARDVVLDACKPQPITLIAQTRIELGSGARSIARPAWERMYEHGMALVATVSERQGEARAVLEAALARTDDAKSRAMITIQLGWVASKQGRADDALALVAETRRLLAGTALPGQPPPNPAVLDAVAVDALVRAFRWKDARAPARACTERAPQNSTAWAVYARVLVAIGDYPGALAASASGLELAPRDPDLLGSQATALSALRRPEAATALAAYDRFRSPDQAAKLRILCAVGSPRCARDLKAVQTLVLR